MSERRKSSCGTDEAVSVCSPDGTLVSLSFWDVWMSLVAADEFDGDLEALVGHFQPLVSTGSFAGLDAERKLAHVRDLQQRLAGAELGVGDVLLAIDEKLTKRQARERARKKVLCQGDLWHERSAPMQRPPSVVYRRHAMRGYWDRFPESPAEHAVQLEQLYQGRKKGKSRKSLNILKLDSFSEESQAHVESGRFCTGQARLRAFLSVVLEQAANDSCGSIGQAYERAIQLYLAIPLEKTGIDNAVFFEDLCELLVWEDLAYTHDQLNNYFSTISEAQAAICIDHLRKQQRALQSDHLKYQSERALTWLGKLCGQRERFEDFVPLAEEMGTREWERITDLAACAVRAGYIPLAASVFEAALTPGYHHEYLRGKYEQLIAEHGSATRLRLVKPEAARASD